MTTWKGILDDVMKGREIPEGGIKCCKYRFTRDKGYRLKRERDPITHKFYDPRKETEYNRQIQEFSEQHKVLSQERRKHSEGYFNVVTLRDVSTGKNCSDITPISSKPKERHFTRRCERDFDTLFGKNVKLSELRNRREYHIINNRFKKNHEERERELNQKFHKNAHKRKIACLKNETDPILHVDCLGNEKKREQVKHRKGGFSKPNGAELVKKRRCMIESKMDRKQLNRMVRMRKSETGVSRTRQGLVNKMEMRKRNKANKLVEERDRSWVGRGYNIMSNLPFQGLESQKPMYVPKLYGKRNLWNNIVKDGV